MAIFVDTGVFVALRNKRDERHKRANELIKEALKERYGRLYTSNFIFDEAVTALLSRTKRIDWAIDLGKFILEAPLTMIFITEEDFKKAWEKFQSFGKLSFTDCTTLVLLERLSIESSISFDSDFNGFVNRLF